jgi:hypothetical protein
MLIFGRTAVESTATFYVYESLGAANEGVDFVTVATGGHSLESPVL